MFFFLNGINIIWKLHVAPSQIDFMTKNRADIFERSN